MTMPAVKTVFETSLPRNAAETRAWLQCRGIHDVRDDDPTSVFDHFNRLAAQGYDLARAHSTAEMEALKAMGRFTPLYTTRYRSRSEEVYDGAGGARHASYFILEGEAAGQAYLEVAESEDGPVDAAYKVHAKILKKFFGVHDPLTIREYTSDAPQARSTAAAVRVNILFSNGMATQFMHSTTPYAAHMALKTGFEMDLRRRGFRPTGTQPR